VKAVETGRGDLAATAQSVSNQSRIVKVLCRAS
jgi:hypothetical protein